MSARPAAFEMRCDPPADAGSTALFEQLRVCSQVTHGVADTLLDRDLWLPPECLEFRCIEMHERRVAEPTALAASHVVSHFFQSEFLDDDVRQIQHAHELVVAKVEDVLAFFRVLHGIKNTVDAIDHIEIGFALPSIAEDFEQLGTRRVNNVLRSKKRNGIYKK